MRTIVINTSKEAISSRLDLLFKAPFDQSSLLWFDTELCEVSDSALRIKQALITDTDTIDRDYNLIVLVDLYKFPHSNEKDAVSIYKALITRHIGVMLVNRLHAELDLIPRETSVYFADSAELENDWTTKKLAKNPRELQQLENKLSVESQIRSKLNANGDIEDENDPDAAENNTEREPVQKRIMEIFGWKEDMAPNEFLWKIKASITDDEYIDFTETFKITAESIKSSHESAKVIDIALESVMAILADRENRDWSGRAVTANVPEILNRDYEIYALTCFFKRDNEQSLIESYFNLFANVFSCVRNKKLTSSVESYDRNRIVEIFRDALKKYRYFSDEKNITVDFEPISNIFDEWEAISDKRKKNADEYNKEYKGYTPEQVADEIMADKSGASDRDNKITAGKMRGIDGQFYDIVSDIFDNYDTEIINEQNNKIVKTCLKCLWKWRDDQTNEEFIRDIKAKFEKNNQGGKYDQNIVSADMAFMKEDYEREYTSLINSITETEHKLAANNDILLETKELMVKYSDLMRKGKKYLICTIGAVIAIVAAALPYIYVQSYSINENIIHRILYILFTAGFIVLYGTASGIYIGKINKEKRILKDALSDLKKKSEDERRESIIALYTFYSDTVVKAETLYLLWREVIRREKENSRKFIKLNNHRKRLEKLTESVKRFMTSLKIEVTDADYEAVEEDIELYKREGLVLDASRSFYDDTNCKIYSILPIIGGDIRDENQKEGENR